MNQTHQGAGQWLCYLHRRYWTGVVVLLVLSMNTASGQAPIVGKAALELVPEDRISLDPPSVIKECTALIAQMPQPGLPVLYAAYDKRSQAYIATGQFATAMSDIERLLKLKPKEPEIKCRHALVQGIMGKVDEALKELRGVIRSDPQFARARILIARQLAMIGKADEAMDHINAGISLDPKDPYAYYARALINYQRNHAEQCLQDISRSISLQPFAAHCQPQYPYYLKGSCLLMLQRPREAISYFLIVKGMDPSSKGATWGLWKAYMDMEKFDLAHRLANEYLRLDPNSTRAKLALLESYSMVNQWEEGSTLISELLANNPMDGVILPAAGNFYSWAGEFHKALGYYNKAIEIDENNLEALHGKAILLACCPLKELRDGPLAVKLADRIRKAENVRPLARVQGIMLQALAKAECNEFDKATRLAQEACNQTAPGSRLRREFEEKVRLFRDKKPYRLPNKRKENE